MPAAVLVDDRHQTRVGVGRPVESATPTVSVQLGKAG